MRFDPNASPACYRSKDEIIQKDTKVRMQLVGCRVEANDMVSRIFYPGGLRMFCVLSLLLLMRSSSPSGRSRRISWVRSGKTDRHVVLTDSSLFEPTRVLTRIRLTGP